MSFNGSINEIEGSSDDQEVSLRSGMKVRVINPRSEHFGTTGHLLGRNDQHESYWHVRFSTVESPILLLDEELDYVR